MLLGYIWLLDKIVNISCDIKNVNIVQNCCRNLAVIGLTKEITYKNKFYRNEVQYRDDVLTKRKVEM